LVGPPPESWAVEPSDAAARELEPGLWRLRLPLGWPGIPHVNAYAIERDDGWLLVDCGSWGDQSCWDALVAVLGQAHIELGDVRLLAATHAHSDHIGVAARVVERSGCEFVMHPDHDHFYGPKREPETFERARRRRAKLEGVPEELLHLYADVGEEVDGFMAPVVPHRGLRAGVRLESRLGDWHVIEAPGHAPSHVLFHQPERRLLITGDLVSKAFAPFFDYGYTPDPVGEFSRSLDLAANLPVDIALPGHGRPIDDLGSIIDEHRRALAQRIEATAAAIDAGPVGAYGVTRRVFGDEAGDFVRVWQFVEVVGYLRHLRVLGRAQRERDAEGAFRYRYLDPSRHRARLFGGV
jgi:glyoxylase-like metal-dependent hydrolase (beta-lactamase superfamily II)